MITTKKEDKRLVQKKHELHSKNKNNLDGREKKPLVFNEIQNPLSFVVDWQLTD